MARKKPTYAGLKECMARLSHAEDALRYHASLIDSVSDAIISTDDSFVITSWNKAAERLFGWTAGEALGKDVRTLLRVEYVGTTRDEVRKRLDDEGSVQFEAAHLRKDGGRIDSMTSVAVVRDMAGKSVGTVGIVRDVTEQERAQEAVARYQLIGQYARDALLLVDMDGMIVDANQAAMDLYGYGREELLRLRIHDLRRRDDAETVERQMRQARAGGVLFEAVHVRKDGSSVAVEVSSRGVAVEGREMLLSVVRDITERKRAEEALRESEKRYRSLFENMLDGFAYCKMIFDGGGLPVDLIYLEVNSTFERLTGLENVVGKRITEVVPGIARSHPELFEIYGRVAMTGKPERFEAEFQPLRAWLSISVYSTEKGYFAAVFENITERKQAEEALRQARGQLEERVRGRTAELERRGRQLRSLALELTRAEQRERTRLAAVLHDNLQQLLVGAMFTAQAARRQAEGKELTETIAKVADLLDESLRASRSLTVELSPPILREAGLVAAVRWLARWMGEKHGLAVEVTAGGEIELGGEEVSILLFQSVKELLFNVVKHAGVKAAQVAIRAPDDTHVEIVVADHGKGFDPARARAEGAEAGFGLSSIRERVDLLSGRLDVDSSPGRGTCVTILAPLPQRQDRQ